MNRLDSFDLSPMNNEHLYKNAADINRSLDYLKNVPEKSKKLDYKHFNFNNMITDRYSPTNY